MVTSSRHLRRFDIFYVLPVLPVTFLMGPLAILQSIYATHFGLALTTIAAVLLISRVFDAVTDPIIGYYADKYHDCHGSRKPFVIAGGLIFVISSWFLYVPPDGVSAEYFLFWFLAFYLGYTLFDIPHLAWGSELTHGSKDKNKIYGLRAFCVYLGGLLFYAMPLLPIFETPEFSPQVLKLSAIVAGLAMLPFLYLSISLVPNSIAYGIYRNDHKPQKFLTLDNSALVALRVVLANKPLRTLTAAHICTGFGSGMWLTLLFLFVDSYLDLGKQFALVYVISVSLSLISMRLWYSLASHWGKQRAWSSGMVSVVIGLIGTGLLSPEDTGWLSLLVCMSLIVCGFAAFNIMVPSLLSDIIDYGTWKFGKDYSASYFSIYSLISKTAAAFGGASSLAIAGLVGFDPVLKTHGADVIVGLRLAVGMIPALIILVSIFFIINIPITTRRHNIIRKRLDSMIHSRHKGY